MKSRDYYPVFTSIKGAWNRWALLYMLWSLRPTTAGPGDP